MRRASINMGAVYCGDFKRPRLTGESPSLYNYISICALLPSVKAKQKSPEAQAFRERSDRSPSGAV